VETTSIDINRKFVRLIERRSDGLVEFEFAIGEPELFVEMLLPEQAFAEFCQINRVEQLPARVDPEHEMAWTLREASRRDPRPDRD